MGERYTGSVDFFNEKLGHGLIIRDEYGSKKLYFKREATSGVDRVAKGERVEFTVDKNRDGIRATDITGPNGTPLSGRGGGGGEASISSGRRSEGGSLCFTCGRHGHQQNNCTEYVEEQIEIVVDSD